MAKRVESALRRLFRRAEILRRRMRFAPQSKPTSGNARSVASFVALGGEGSAHAFLSSVILVCVGASPPSICEEPSSALFYFLSISFPFLLSNAVGVSPHCDRSAAASGAVRRAVVMRLPSSDAVGGEGLFCYCFLAVSDAVRRTVVVRLPADGGGRVLFSIPCCRNRLLCGRRLLCGCQPMKLKQRDVPDSGACGVWRVECLSDSRTGGRCVLHDGGLLGSEVCLHNLPIGWRARWQIVRLAARDSVWRLRFAAGRACGTPPVVSLSAVVPYAFFRLVSVCAFALALQV